METSFYFLLANLLPQLFSAELKAGAVSREKSSGNEVTFGKFQIDSIPFLTPANQI